MDRGSDKKCKVGRQDGSRLGHVVKGNSQFSLIIKWLKRQKSLFCGSQMLAMSIEKKTNQNSKPEAPKWATQYSGFY